MKQFFLRSRLQKKHLIAVVILFQLVVVASMFMKAWRIKHYAVKNNTIVRISCTAYDPFNPFKGRYVRLTLSQNDLESEGKKLGIDLQKLSKNCSDYYMQENYANFIDKISSKNLNDLNPVLEVYVDKKGGAIQKALLVQENNKEIPIEEYIRLVLRGEISEHCN